MCLGDRDYETSNRRFQCWKPPITLNTLPLLHRSSVSLRLEVTCHWPVINELARTPWSSSVSESLHLLRRLSVPDSCFLCFLDLWDSLVKGCIVCVFSVSLCLLQSRGEHHLFLHLTGTSFSPPLLQPNPCRKKIKNSICLYMTQRLAWGIRYWAP